MAETKGAQLGPRIIGRLTPELILRSPQYMNPVKQYEIDLRANRIAAIENLGATEVRALPAGSCARRRAGAVPARLEARTCQPQHCCYALPGCVTHAAGL